MRRKRRNHSPEFKAKVALAALRGDRTMAELANLLCLAVGGCAVIPCEHFEPGGGAKGRT